ncbi:MAG TPA: tRNA uridine-5-carboxymethylaminomethyl(34) synthesis GTPase MnmE [Syntrophales bacterium]|nr:tRNA uridine-5-carboxymethylaminomethyl(34) synthesis GTPase MnmE [Syntrophales bacterium]HOL58277.1 tRNA uridine-5-carboxymethylaminomethyl(34) synthesis GTPase MnmE [Syntrophales bacterium]HPO34446.1 tRNA uridine-5-carboxymethylaminomethyl(34) synthesis GTPase MnmE [Syntrophales bacterium]
MTLDTIAALATTYGPGALAVIRISGPEAENILKAVFRPRHRHGDFFSHRLYHGDLVCPQTGKYIDEVLVCLMRGPHSYTGEDVVEIFCHGGLSVPRAVLASVIQAGARPAERGEFTRRAFINGRLDLTQAEAIAEVVTAQGEKGREVALRQLKGELKSVIEGLTGRLKECLARMEAAIDFIEDVSDKEVAKGVEAEIGKVREEIVRLAGTYRQGRLYREGAAIVILGRPNVGKSSLLNCLLGRKRAIVTPIPGTTRDFLEEMWEVKGLLVRVIDTAGIRPTEDALEEAGIQFVWEKVQEADLILFLVDGSERLTAIDRAIMERVAERRVLPVINKMDLPCVLEEEALAKAFSIPALRISAKYGEGIEQLTNTIYQMLVGEEEISTVAVTQARHLHCLERAAQALEKSLKRDVLSQTELACEEVKEAIEALGEITGEKVSPDVLDIIFSTFCVGK